MSLRYHSHEPPPLREAHIKAGVIVAARLGDTLHPHALVVAGTRYSNQHGRMTLTGLALELVAAVPGNVAALVDMLATIMPRAQERAAEGLGKHELALDVTRQQLAYLQVQERVEVSFLMLCTTHARKLASTPYWNVGRITLLSNLAAQLARPGVLQVLEPAGADDPRVWSRGQVREALDAATAKPPAVEEDGFVTDSTTQDDVALTIAMAAMRAEDGAPDPWVEGPAYVAA
jgi:hypothetical protein